MEKTVRALRAPAALIERPEHERRLPPGSGLLIAFVAAFLFYAALIATLA